MLNMLKCNEVKSVFVSNVESLFWSNSLTDDIVEAACRLHPGFFAEIRCVNCDFQPSTAELKRIAEYFGIELEELFEYEPKSKEVKEYLLRYKRYVSVISIKLNGKKIQILE